MTTAQAEKKIKKTLSKTQKKTGSKFAGTVERFQQALKKGIVFTKNILREVDEFQAKHPLEGVFVVILGSLIAVLLGEKMVIAGGVTLNVASHAALTALLTLNPELARLSLVAAKLGLSAIFIGEVMLVCGVIAAVRSVCRFVQWIGSKLGLSKGPLL